MTRRLSRREFVKTSAEALLVLGVSSALPFGFGVERAYAFAQSPKIRKFITSLPGLGPSGANEIGQYLPVASKTTQSFAGLATDVYNLGVAQYDETMHPDLPGPTHFWGYYDKATKDKKYLGGVVVAKRGTPVLFNVTNELPNSQLVPIDPTVMAGPNQMVGDLPFNRTCVHLHGGHTPWFSDGTPFQWFDPKGAKGASFMNVPGTNPPVGTATNYYPMDQSARFVWYHDHSIGITRTNAYSGIASAFVILDDFEIGLVNSGLLPDLVGIPLVIQDKSFVPLDIMDQDPTWQWGAPGDLWYPHVYEVNTFKNGKENPKGRWDWGPTVDPPSMKTKNLPTPACLIPEAFFDAILVNGGVYPVVNVPPRRMRFRLLNGSQARFYHLNLLAEDPSNPGEAKLGAAGPKIYQVGTEGGFLPGVAIHDNKTQLAIDSEGCANPDGPFNLMLAPAERGDVVIDFNGVPAGTTFIVYNDAPAPFPCGDSRNDYFTDDGDQTSIGGAPNTLPGNGPNTRTLMKIVVGAGAGDSVPTSTWLSQINAKLKTNFLTGNQPLPIFRDGGNPTIAGFPYSGPISRQLTLNEDFDMYGRLIQTMGTMKSKSTDNQGLPTWGLGYLDTPTETPSAGATEYWQIFNLTADVHPIHFHLVNVQLLQRQTFEGTPDSYSLTGSPMRPNANELGWKETVRCNPEEVTTVAMKFDLPSLPTSAMRNAVSPRTGGKEYVWHCHILEHEEHDMMRPLIVK